MNSNIDVKHEEDPLSCSEIKAEPQVSCKFLILCSVLFLQKDNDVREIQIQTVKPLIPEPTLLEVEIAIGKLTKYKSPGIDQILAELIQDGGNSLLTEIYKLELAIWKNEMLPEQWKESIIVPIYKKGEKTNCSNY